MTCRHSLCETRARILRTQSSCLDMSLAWDRCNKVQSPYMGNDKICFLTFALLGKLKTFSPWNRLGDDASFGSGQIQPLPIFNLGAHAQRGLLYLVCVSVCLSPLILALQGPSRLISDTNDSSATRARKDMWRFCLNGGVREIWR